MAKIVVGTENGAPIELYYEDHGSGKPVVLIHGWPLSGRAWEQQVPALIEAGYRVITYDRRGFGQSSQPWIGYDFDTLTADLHQLMETLDLREATLVGFSMGGGEVARYISTYGTERISKAVLAGSITPYLYKSSDNPDGGYDDEGLTGFQNVVKADRLAFLETSIRGQFSTEANPSFVSDAVIRYFRDIAAFASPKATLDCIAAFAYTDFREDLKKIQVPTLIIHGDTDSDVPFEISGKRSHEAIPGSHLVVVEGGPHGINATHAEVFNAELIRFLQN